MPRLSPPPILLTIALSLTVAACGGVDPAERASADGSRAAARTADQRTARFELVDVEHEGAVEFRNECAGAVDIERSRYRLVCTQGGGDGLGYEILRVTGVEYTRWIDHSESTNVGEEWRSVAVDPDDDRTTFDPVRLLARLRSASSDVEPVGRDRVRGVATEHVRLLVERRETDPSVADVGASDLVWVDVWVDGDGLLRRIRIDRGPGAASTLEFFDFGVALVIEPPPADEMSPLGETEFEPDPCAAHASPLTEATVVTVLREHGIGVRRDTDTCHAPDVAAELINVRFDGPDAEAERNAVERREGVVWCFLHARPAAGAGTTVQRDGVDVEVSFTLANLECTIFPEGEPSAPKIERLERAFAALARSLD